MRILPELVSAEQLRELYQNARALVFAGVEDFGIAFAESQACGTPVVALDRGGVRDIVATGPTGVLFAEATVAGLKKAIRPIWSAWTLFRRPSAATACVSPRPASGRNSGDSSARGADDQKAKRTTGPAVRPERRPGRHGRLFRCRSGCAFTPACWRSQGHAVASRVTWSSSRSCCSSSWSISPTRDSTASSCAATASTIFFWSF